MGNIKQLRAKYSDALAQYESALERLEVAQTKVESLLSRAIQEPENLSEEIVSERIAEVKSASERCSVVESRYMLAKDELEIAIKLDLHLLTVNMPNRELNF